MPQRYIPLHILAQLQRTLFLNHTQGMRDDFNRCFPLKNLAEKAEESFPGGIWRTRWSLKDPSMELAKGSRFDPSRGRLRSIPPPRDPSLGRGVRKGKAKAKVKAKAKEKSKEKAEQLNHGLPGGEI